MTRETRRRTCHFVVYGNPTLTVRATVACALERVGRTRGAHAAVRTCVPCVARARGTVTHSLVRSCRTRGAHDTVWTCEPCVADTHATVARDLVRICRAHGAHTTVRTCVPCVALAHSLCRTCSRYVGVVRARQARRRPRHTCCHHVLSGGAAGAHRLAGRNLVRTSHTRRAWCVCEPGDSRYSRHTCFLVCRVLIRAPTSGVTRTVGDTPRVHA